MFKKQADSVIQEIEKLKRAQVVASQERERELARLQQQEAAQRDALKPRTATPPPRPNEALPPRQAQQLSQQEELETKKGGGVHTETPLAKSAPPQQPSATWRPTPVEMPQQQLNPPQRLQHQSGADKTESMTVTLDMNFDQCGEPGSSRRLEFEKDLATDLARAAGVPATNFRLRSLSSGSIIAQVDVYPAGNTDARSIITYLIRQIGHPSSPLRSGHLTGCVSDMRQ